MGPGDEHLMNPFHWNVRNPHHRRYHDVDPEVEQRLTQQLMALSSNLTPSKESQQMRLKFVSKLQRIIDTEWPTRSITAHVFGSTVNGLGTQTSDVDVCLTTAWEDRANGVSNMDILAAGLIKHGIAKVTTVTAAKVPICKLYDPEFNVNCDINVNNTIALRNTQLIKTYVAIDPRVRHLMMVIKYWTRQRALNDAAKGGTLSSYCWAMMVLNFLQTRQPPVLPCLHEMYFARRTTDPASVNPVICDGIDCSFYEDLETLRGFGAPNMESVGQLLLGFFRRYAVEFDYEQLVISVRHGRYITKDRKGWDVDIERHRRFLCVEEPFNPQRNLANSADAVSVTGLRQEFDRALSLLTDRQDYEQVCEQYIPPDMRSSLVNGNGVMQPQDLRRIDRIPQHHYNGRSTNGGEVNGGNWQNFETYRSQLPQHNYGKQNAKTNSHYFYTNHPPYSHVPNGSSGERRSSTQHGPGNGSHHNFIGNTGSNGYGSRHGSNSGNGDGPERRSSTGFNPHKAPGPFSQEDLQRISALSLESRHLETHSKRHYAPTSSLVRRAGDLGKRNVLPLWSNSAQSGASHTRSKAHGPNSIDGNTPAPSKLAAIPGDVGPVPASPSPSLPAPTHVTDLQPPQESKQEASWKPITVVIEKQAEGESVIETSVAEIDSQHHLRTLSCSRSDAGSERSSSRAEARSPEPSTPTPTPSLTIVEPVLLNAASEIKKPVAPVVVTDDIPRLPASSVRSRRKTAPDVVHRAIVAKTQQTTVTHNGETVSGGVAKDLRKNRGYLSDEHHSNSGGKEKQHAPRNQSTNGNGSRTQHSRPSQAERPSNGVWSNIGPDVKKADLPVKFQSSDHQDSPSKVLAEQVTSVSLASPAEAVLPTATDSPSAAIAVAAETSSNPKRRGSKGTLLWANHSHHRSGHRGANSTATVAEGVAPTTPTCSRSGATSRNGSPTKAHGGGSSEPSTPRPEYDPAYFSNPRGRPLATASAGKNTQGPKPTVQLSRPRSLSVSNSPRNVWQDVRSARSPERVDSARNNASIGNAASSTDVPPTPSSPSPAISAKELRTAPGVGASSRTPASKHMQQQQHQSKHHNRTGTPSPPAQDQRRGGASSSAAPPHRRHASGGQNLQEASRNADAVR
ncbi:hypothetical protein HKX48_007752 [Thoreauomyces humboldtii]|nr:hypothetical protein HKX48_007752 [Thoreauomyces humboldtii]